MKKPVVAVLTVILILAVAGGAFIAVKKSTTQPVAKPKAVPTALPTSTPVPLNDAMQIKQALYAKNNWPQGRYGISIANNDGAYVKGAFRPVAGGGGGGLFFAAKKDGAWKIVADGNGIIQCESLKDYPAFPKELIPACFDQATGKLVQR